MAAYRCPTVFLFIIIFSGWGGGGGGGAKGFQQMKECDGLAFKFPHAHGIYKSHRAKDEQVGNLVTMQILHSVYLLKTKEKSRLK